MIIQHNMAAMNSARQLGITGNNQAKSTEKLSSGYRINRAADDAAGLAISEKMRGQIRGLAQASTNSEDAISLVQTAEGAMQESQNVIHRMRELAVQAATDTNTDDDRAQIQKEIDQLTQEVDRIASTTEFNTKKLLDGSVQGNLKQEDGSTDIEGTFANSNVAVKSSEQGAVASRDGVIRIEIGKTSDGEIKWSSCNVYGIGDYDLANLSEWVSVDGISSGSINVNGAVLGKSNFVNDKWQWSNADITSASTNKMTFSVSGGEHLQAGDVITISISSVQLEESAEEDNKGLRFQIGANASQEVELGIKSVKSKDLKILNGEGNALNVTNQHDASMAIEAYDMALTRISTERAKLGAVQNRLEHTIANLDTSEENLQAAESRIRDVDMADEMTSYSKLNILQQAGTSMLSNANSSTQSVLQLLQG